MVQKPQLDQSMDLAELEAVYSKMLATLQDDEKSWVARQEFLQERGYMLRPRFRPGWVPSWTIDKSVDMECAEDGIALPVSTYPSQRSRPFTCIRRFV